jgi:hypothetical protein
MHLIMAREAVDKHLQVAGALVDPKAPIGKKLGALPKIAAFYAWWYPTRWLGWSYWPRYASFGRFATHLRFVDRAARKLARESFHGMFVYRAKMERKQAFLFRLVDVVNELFAMAASVSRAHALARSGDPSAESAAELADAFCRQSRRRVKELFRALWANDDQRRYQLAQSVLAGDHRSMEALLDELARAGEHGRAEVAAATRVDTVAARA